MNHKNYDLIIIGAGHNGLVAAALLAQARQRVLVLERRNLIGGAAATEELFPGCRINTGAHDAGLFRPEIVAKLALDKHGLEFIKSPVAAFAPQSNGEALTIWRDIDKSQQEIARFSKTDAEKYPRFAELMEKLAGTLDAVMLATPPRIAANLDDLVSWLAAALKIKRLGRHEMMEFLRILPLSVKEFLDEWFESSALKALLGATGVAGSMQGPRASGTSFMLLYHYLGASNGGFRSSQFVRGGIGRISEALAAAAKEHGAEIRTGVEVEKILIDDDRATGVLLANGEAITATAVVSNADPKRTYLQLAGAPNLEPTMVRRVRNIRMRGSTAKVSLVLDGLPRFAGSKDEERLSGHIIICPSLDYLERAYDDAKYGRYSLKPALDIVIPTILDSSLAPTGKHLMSITMQYAPYQLREIGWGDQHKVLGERVVDVLSAFVPSIRDLIIHRHVTTPLDWETRYGLTEGSIFHGQMGLDQLLFMRPVPGWARYRTPVDGLYLCGAGTHPGGGVTGAPGFNAAREILKDLKKSR